MNKFQSMTVMAFLFILSGCGNDVAEAPQPAEEDWTPTVTRTGGSGGEGTFSEDIRISAVADLSKLSETAFSDIFLKTGNWEENGNHSWGSNKALHLIATSPTGYAETGIPTTVLNGDIKGPLMAGYRHEESKPSEKISFTMYHLMGKLQVHIKIAGNADKAPENARLSLYKCKRIDYANIEKPKVEAYSSTDAEASISEDLDLGSFGEDNTAGSGNYVNTPQVIIPQTLKKGVKCLSFTIGNAIYTFTPENNIELKQGRLTHLYLGIAYDEKVIQIGNGVSVEDWNGGASIGNGEEATEEPAA